MQVPYFGRLLTAMVTTMNEDGSVNYKAMGDLAEWLIANGSDGLVVCGTTGESPTLTFTEKVQLYRTVIERVGDKVPVIAGTGSYNTAASIELSQAAAKEGADGLLLVGPYYNKPPQEGYYQHFKAIADAVALPIIVYNVPPRTSSNIEPVTVQRLARDCQNIVAIKEAGGSVAQVAELYALLPEDFTIYSGDDVSILPFMSVGATGLISVLSNIGGNLLQALMKDYVEGRVDDAKKLNKQMLPLAHAVFVKSNPIPIKEAVSMVAPLAAGPVRLPLVPLSREEHEVLKATLIEHKVL